MKPQAINLYVVLYLAFPVNINGLWWVAGNQPLNMTPSSICRKSRRLGGKQKDICSKDRQIVDEIANGGKMAIAECQHQFERERWNCPNVNKTISKALDQDTAESAFLQAISSAGVTYAVTQACSMGLLPKCACNSDGRDVKMDGEWAWGSCNDDVDFGYVTSRDFLDVTLKQRPVFGGGGGGTKKRKKAEPKPSDVRAKLLLLNHNNEVGRMVVKSNLKTECRCHGLSSSCALRTCWKRMPSLREIGDLLKTKYQSADQITVPPIGDSRLFPVASPETDSTVVVVAGSGSSRDASSSSVGSTATPARRVPPQPSPVGIDTLAYVAKSTNYCKLNRTIGSLGTKGRICNPESVEVDGCEVMCCDRGYTTEIVEVEENCKCQFRYCCEVVCQSCRAEKMMRRCR